MNVYNNRCLCMRLRWWRKPLHMCNKPLILIIARVDSSNTAKNAVWLYLFFCLFLFFSFFGGTFFFKMLFPCCIHAVRHVLYVPDKFIFFLHDIRSFGNDFNWKAPQTIAKSQMKSKVKPATISTFNLWPKRSN